MAGIEKLKGTDKSDLNLRDRSFGNPLANG